MPTRKQILAASGRELDKLVHILKGGVILTAEEMHTEAEAVWREQPHVRLFFTGFVAERNLNGTVMVKQTFAPYHSFWQHAGPLLEEMAESMGWPNLCPRGTGWTCGYSLGAQISALGWAGGKTPQEAIARAYCLWRLERGEQSC